MRPSRWSGRLSEELLSGSKDGLLIGTDFDLRDGFDGYGYALFCVEVLLRGYVKAHEFE